MTFGRRFSVHNERVPVVIQKTCERCFGTGHVRERGNRLRCKQCAGSGRIAAQGGEQDRGK